MILFTVDESRIVKKTLKDNKNFKKEYGTFGAIVNIFSVWFVVLTSIRAILVATIIVSLFNNQPDLIYAWNQGYGFIGLLVYFLASFIDLLRILDIGIFVAVIIGSFSIGNGITANFVPFLLPIAICYALCFGLILASNFLINAIVEKTCPKIYSYIEYQTRFN